MVIGIDLRVFQIGHQYRGIGAHISNLLAEFSKVDENLSFVFFEHPNVETGLGMIKQFLPKLNYEIRYTNNRLVGETYFQREWESFKQRVLVGDAGLGDLSDIDVLLSVDFNLGVPKPSKINTVLIAYDMIPWVLSGYYLPSFAQNFKKSKNIKSALKSALDKRLYFWKLKQANQRAKKIIAISEHTKNDLIKYLHVDRKKITTVLLGIRKSSGKKQKSIVKMNDYYGNSTSFDTRNNSYVFFMGGADRRRKIEDLVCALENLPKNNVSLVLAGYDFQNYKTVPDNITRLSIKNSKKRNSIFFAGFISDQEKNALFASAIAFVFPSIYEGFGLPILESMDLQCPVITYKNSSISEIGGNAVLYASSTDEISKSILDIQKDTGLRNKLITNGNTQVEKFSWQTTANKTLEILKLT